MRSGPCRRTEALYHAHCRLRVASGVIDLEKLLPMLIVVGVHNLPDRGMPVGAHAIPHEGDIKRHVQFIQQVETPHVQVGFVSGKGRQAESPWDSVDEAAEIAVVVMGARGGGRADQRVGDISLETSIVKA